jgi:hypothetical protein
VEIFLFHAFRSATGADFVEIPTHNRNHDIYSDNQEQSKSNFEENISSPLGDKASSSESFVIVPVTGSSAFFSCVNRTTSLSALSLQPCIPITNLSSHEWHHPSPSPSHRSIVSHNRRPDPHLVERYQSPFPTETLSNASTPAG